MKPGMNFLFSTLFAFVAVLLSTASFAQDEAPVIDEDEEFLAGGGEESGEVAEEEGDAEEVTEAEGETGGEGETSEKWGGKLRDHRHQGFVNVLFGTGWYMVAPYDKNDPKKACSDIDAEGEGEPVCSGRSPFHLDFLAGFGVKDGLEVFAMFKLGLDQPNSHLPDQLRMIGAGIKVYSPSDGLFKISFGVAPLFDFSPRETDKYDFLIHVPIAAHFDFIPWLGAYLQVAPNISFVTEFKLDITAGIGIQGRFP